MDLKSRVELGILASVSQIQSAVWNTGESITMHWCSLQAIMAEFGIC